MRRRSLMTLASSLAVRPAGGRPRSPLVYRLAVSGVVENGLAPYVARGLREAAAAGAAAVYLDIDTPGGRIDAAERIADAVGASAVPVYAFVNPRAYSAGALIALSSKAHLHAARRRARRRDAGGRRRGTRPPRRWSRPCAASSARWRRRAGSIPAIAEAMVDERVEVPGVDEAGRAAHAQHATRRCGCGFAKGAPCRRGGAAPRHRACRAHAWCSIEPNWAELVVRFLTNPLVSPLLLSLGVLGLVFEIKTGAFGLGGLVSLVSLGLFFGSSFLVGLAGWEEVILLGVGLVALAVEVFVLPGFGAAGILGHRGARGGGRAGHDRRRRRPPADVTQALVVLGASLAITAAVAYAWLRHLPNSGRFAGLFLRGGAHQADGYIAALPRVDLVGQDGIAVTDLRPAGTAQIGHERVDVVTEGEYVPQGAPVRVVRSEGYRHVVRGLQ